MVISTRKCPINVALGVVLLRDWLQGLIISFFCNILLVNVGFYSRRVGIFQTSCWCNQAFWAHGTVRTGEAFCAAG